MGATITVTCPLCERNFSLRFDPGVEDEAPTLAMDQLARECPNHDGQTWDIWTTQEPGND